MVLLKLLRFLPQTLLHLPTCKMLKAGTQRASKRGHNLTGLSRVGDIQFYSATGIYQLFAAKQNR